MLPGPRGLWTVDFGLRTSLAAIQRALCARAALAENERVNHRRRDIVMAQQLLNRADVRAALEQCGGKAVSERV
jgi:hypothetical protein